MRAHTLVASLAALAAAACAWSSATFTTFQFDDFAVIVDEPRVHSFAAWWQSMPGLRPLLKLSYAASWQVGGGAAVAFVAFNLAVHAINALLVLLLMRRLLRDAAPDVAQSPAAALVAVATAVAVFALHPAQTEAVTYLSGRSTSLMATFWLAALVAWLHPARIAHAAAIGLFALAMSAKESAIAWPLAVLLVEALRGGWRSALARSWPAFAAAGAALAALAAVPAYRHLARASLAIRPPSANLATAVDGVGYLVTYPLAGLATNIDPDIVATAFAAGWWLRAALIVGALVLGIVALRRGPPRYRRVAGFAIVWFFATLVPTQSLIARLDIANDRQLYVAIIGPAFAFGVAVARSRHAWAATIVVAAILATATLLRNRDYASEVALWRATASASPYKARPWNNLGYALQMAGDSRGAGDAYRQALLLDPGDLKAAANLAIIERNVGSAAR